MKEGLFAPEIAGSLHARACDRRRLKGRKGRDLEQENKRGESERASTVSLSLSNSLSLSLFLSLSLALSCSQLLDHAGVKKHRLSQGQ